jgi:hypothetical protein
MPRSASGSSVSGGCVARTVSRPPSGRRMAARAPNSRPMCSTMTRSRSSTPAAAPISRAKAYEGRRATLAAASRLGLLPDPRGEIAGEDGDQEEHEQRQQVLRLRDREGEARFDEEEVVDHEPQQRGEDRRAEPADARSAGPRPGRPGSGRRARPAPVTSTAPTSGSVAQRRSATTAASIIASERAFKRSGRLSVSVATRSSSRKNRSCAAASIDDLPTCCPAWAGLRRYAGTPPP